jgi:small subunit ribosomal protein S8
MKNNLWNMLANIQNGQLAKKAFVLQNRKKMCEAFLSIMWNEGFILGYKISGNRSDKLKIFLKYNNGKPVINSFKPISKPSRRIYYSVKQLWKIDSNKIFMVLSTNRGLKSIIDCKKLKVGGEPFVIIN